jgi:methylenetetrahydrofolate--tRNA-(uracil-5-)-methyltransferase
MLGVEGYLESAAAGLLAGLNAARLTQGLPLLTAPPTTALGSMIAYISSDERRDFQPMNANYGLFPPLANRVRGREKKAALAERALRDFGAWQTTVKGDPLATVNPHSTAVSPQWSKPL